jgi:DNA-directed RNA polymerase subunit M/transcription elongation factor TFIIS
MLLAYFFSRKNKRDQEKLDTECPTCGEKKKINQGKLEKDGEGGKSAECSCLKCGGRWRVKREYRD